MFNDQHTIQPDPREEDPADFVLTGDSAWLKIGKGKTLWIRKTDTGVHIEAVASDDVEDIIDSWEV